MNMIGLTNITFHCTTHLNNHNGKLIINFTNSYIKLIKESSNQSILSQSHEINSTSLIPYHLAAGSNN